MPSLYVHHAVEGEDVMDALSAITHRRTVPQVFIKGDFIGGCDGKCMGLVHVHMHAQFVCVAYAQGCT